METKKINLNELFKSQNRQDMDLPKWARDLCMEFGKQLLELAAKNARLGIFPGCQYGYLSNEEIFVEEESILETIKQVE